MSYLILAFFSAFLLFSAGALQRDNLTDAQTQQAGVMQYQAASTLRYMNALNSYLYYHPVADGTISDSLLSTPSLPGCYTSSARSVSLFTSPPGPGCSMHWPHTPDSLPCWAPSKPAACSTCAAPICR